MGSFDTNPFKISSAVNIRRPAVFTLENESLHDPSQVAGDMSHVVIRHSENKNVM